MRSIQVWRFYDAPKELQELSEHGGDEDWLALIPKEYENDYIRWLEEGSFDNDVTEHTLSNGDRVRIGAHA
jgi:hypothetical protein